MKEVEYFFWYLPPERPSRKPRLSRWKMPAEEAAKLGAIEAQMSSREVRLLPENEEEARRAMTRYHSAGIDGVRSIRDEQSPKGKDPRQLAPPRD